MKLPKLFLALLLFFVSFQICPAQAKPNLELYDEMAALNCSEVRLRTDTFLIKLRDEPEATGYIVFYAGETPIQFSFYENAFKSHVKMRRFPENHVKFINGAPREEFKVEFWISRNGDKPTVEEKPSSLILNPDKSRYLFAADWLNILKHEGGRLSYFSESECAIETVNFSLLAKYLEANPEMTVEIFVYNKKRSRARQIIKLFINEANDKYKIPLHRLKISYAGIDEETDEWMAKISTVKIWLVLKEEKG
jgi:hypothetical protein